MENVMEHDECSTDARHSLRQCRVVLEKIDLEKYNLTIKNESQKAPKTSTEKYKWRRSVNLKKYRLRGYVHTPEEYERIRSYLQMRHKNRTPEQRARISAHNAMLRQRAKERELLRKQSLKPEDMEQELERRREFNRIKKARRLRRQLALTEQEREAEKAAARLYYHKLTDEQRELNKARMRERYRAKLKLKYETPIENRVEKNHWRKALTDEQRERKNARDRERRKAIRTAIKNGQYIHNPYSLSDEQRERKSVRDRIRYRDKMLLKNETGQDSNRGGKKLTEQQRERMNARARERYRAKMMLKNTTELDNTHQTENLSQEQRESTKIRRRGRSKAKIIPQYGTGQNDDQRERKNLLRRERRRAIKTAKESGQYIHDPESLTDEQRARKNARARERYRAKMMHKSRTVKEIDENSTHGLESTTQHEQ